MKLPIKLKTGELAKGRKGGGASVFIQSFLLTDGGFVAPVT